MPKYLVHADHYDGSAPGDSHRAVDVYVPDDLTDGSSRDMLVFVHGGAWRAGDKRDHRNIPSFFTTSTPAPLIATPNYRLSYNSSVPDREVVVHPVHIQDVYRSLLFLAHLDDQTGQTWPKPARIWIAGHSCGAHIVSHILYGLPGITDGLADGHKEALPRLQNLIAGYLFLDGIYDLPDLIDEYPDYAGFVTEAFGQSSAWPAASISRMEGLPAVPQIPLLVAHSKEDELLTTRQSRGWLEFLQNQKAAVEWNDETLQGKHDDCLQNDGLGSLLRQFMRMQ